MMKQYYTLIALFYLFSMPIIAQDLPESMHFSADGRRLITGDKTPTGFYTETRVRRVDLVLSFGAREKPELAGVLGASISGSTSKR